MKPSLDQITAVILAGGFGTRVQHLLRDVPKPMASVAGKPFLEWVVRYVGRQAIHQAMISTGYLAETIERHFQTQQVKGVTVRCVPETEPLGTAGGFLNAARTSGEKPAAWLVLNGDSLALASLCDIVTKMADPQVAGVLLGVSVSDTSRFGTIEYDAAGNLLAFKEKTSAAGVINAGIYLFRNSALELFPSHRPLSFEKEVFPVLLKQGVKLKVHVTNAPFLDIGTPESLQQAEAFIREGLPHFSVQGSEV